MDIVFYKSHIGYMSTAQATIEANRTTGENQFIMFDFCGNLDKEIVVGKGYGTYIMNQLEKEIERRNV